MLLLKQNQEFKELIVSQNNQIVELSKTEARITVIIIQIVITKHLT